MKKSVIKWLLPAVVLLNACKKDENISTIVDPPVVTAPTVKVGVYVLSEGGFGANNAKLGYRVDSSGVYKGDYFLDQNPTLTGGLGDLGNDAIIYGSKLYVVMNGSNNVTVLNAKNGTYINTISFIIGMVAKGPRNAIGYNGKVYVTAYDGTVSVIDTSSLAIVNSIAVGPNPEGLAAVGNYLYVANSGGLNPVPDSTVSVVDLNTNLEVLKITVCVNPQNIQVNSIGDLYVSGYGDFGAIPATISVINTATKTLKTTLGPDFQYNRIRIFNDTAYLFNNYGGTGSQCKMLNTLNNTEIRSEFITDGTAITTVYGLEIDEQNGDVYIADAIDFSSAGAVTCFGRNGVKKFSFSTAPGVNPNKILFLK